MTARQQLIESIDEFRELDVPSDGRTWVEHLADHLLSVLAPPCAIGDVVYFILDDPDLDYHLYISEETVTEIGQKGFFISAYFPPQDDTGEYILYDELGKTCFLTREEAEEALAERSNR